ncbi:MAG: LrgB family protein [Duncaniella sp.]|nr:LrgB family protein [Duncaniella sp.]
MEFFESDIFLIAATFAIYLGAKRLQAATGWTVLNPVLITILVIIGGLKLSGLTYETYSESGQLIEFWLKPAIVALGVPLYSQLQEIRRQFLPILLSQLAGCVAGIISVVFIAQALGASTEVVLSMVPKSVTTPIAIEVSRQIGGIPSLTAAIVVCVGLLGSIFGFKVLTIGHIGSQIARSISMGTAAHVIGTTRAAELSDRAGAYATLGLILNGVLTAVLADPLLAMMGIK